MRFQTLCRYQWCITWEVVQGELKLVKISDVGFKEMVYRHENSAYYFETLVNSFEDAVNKSSTNWPFSSMLLRETVADGPLKISVHDVLYKTMRLEPATGIILKQMNRAGITGSDAMVPVLDFITERDITADFTDDKVVFMESENGELPIRRTHKWFNKQLAMYDLPASIFRSSYSWNLESYPNLREFYLGQEFALGINFLGREDFSGHKPYWEVLGISEKKAELMKLFHDEAPAVLRYNCIKQLSEEEIEAVAKTMPSDTKYKTKRLEALAANQFSFDSSLPI